jgi:hypothetical protein
LLGLDGGVNLAKRGDGAVAHQGVVDPEVRVGLEVIDGVELGDHVGHEVVDLVVVAQRSKLGQPNRAAAANLMGLLDVVEQGVGVLGLGVPVDDAEVNGASSLSVAGLHEVLQPGDTHLTTAVGDGGRANLGATSEGVHLLLVHASSIGRRHVGLVNVVGLVEAEKSLGTVGESGLGVLLPVAKSLLTPAHGDEGDAGVEVATAGAPVVGPVAALAGVVVRVGEISNVVSHTTLAGQASRGRRRLGLLGLVLDGVVLNRRLLGLGLDRLLGLGVDGVVLDGRFLGLVLDGRLLGLVLHRRLNWLGGHRGDHGGGRRRGGRGGLGSGSLGGGRDNDNRSRGDDGVDGVNGGLGRTGLLTLGDIDGLPDGLKDSLHGALGHLVGVAVVVVSAGLLGESGHGGNGNDLGMHDAWYAGVSRY